MNTIVDAKDGVIDAVAQARFADNLRAVASTQPDIAHRIESSTPPDGAVLTTGRDGSPTFAFDDQSDNRRQWFGASSMPTVSAAETLGGFASDGLNVALPGILTGFEVIFLARRCPTHAAVFVIERDFAAIRLAMHLHDYTGLISAGRLVFVDGRRLAESLQTFFEAHPGYELPTRLVRVWQLSPSEIDELQRELEGAGERVAAVWKNAIDSERTGLSGEKSTLVPESPRVAVLSVDARPAVIEHARAVARAMDELGWHHRLCVPDAPSQCHTVARLRAVRECNADVVLMIGGLPGPLRSFLPDDLPIVSWYTLDLPVPASIEEKHETADMVVVSALSVGERLVQSGLAKDRIEFIELATEDTAVGAQPMARNQRPGDATDIAVFMDLPNDRPEAAAVSLTSHIALWKAMQDGVLRRPDAYRDADASGFLALAEKESGTQLKDPKLREQFLGLFRHRIAPACIARSCVAALARDGNRVAVWGSHWPARDGGPELRRGSIPSGDELAELLASVRVVVLLDVSPRSLQLALRALAAGVAVVCRGDERVVRDQHPGLVELLPALHISRSCRDLVSACSNALLQCEERTGSPPDDPSESLTRNIVLARHTYAHRLQQVISRLRDRTSANPTNE